MSKALSLESQTVNPGKRLFKKGLIAKRHVISLWLFLHYAARVRGLMNRTQIQLTEEQHTLLREISKDTKEPISALIRKAVDQFLLTRRPDRFYLYKRAQTIVGKYEAGVSDISVNHDHYLEEAYRS